MLEKLKGIEVTSRSSIEHKHADQQLNLALEVIERIERRIKADDFRLGQEYTFPVSHEMSETTAQAVVKHYTDNGWQANYAVRKSDKAAQIVLL